MGRVFQVRQRTLEPPQRHRRGDANTEAQSPHDSHGKPVSERRASAPKRLIFLLAIYDFLCFGVESTPCVRNPDTTPPPRCTRKGNRRKQTDPRPQLAPRPTAPPYRHCEAPRTVAIHGDAPRLPLAATSAAQHGSPRPVGARDDAFLAVFCYMRLPGARDDGFTQFRVSYDCPAPPHCTRPPRDTKRYNPPLSRPPAPP